MDFGATPKTFATGAVQATVRTDISVQNVGGAAVELPPEKTVRPVPAGERRASSIIRAEQDATAPDAQRPEPARAKGPAATLR
jgi:flagellar protein FlaG